MSVQDILFAASGNSTNSIKYQVGVYDLPATATWTTLIFANDRTVILGGNRFLTLTDPADQSTFVEGALPSIITSAAKLVVNTAQDTIMTVTSDYRRMSAYGPNFTKFIASSQFTEVVAFSPTFKDTVVYKLYDITNNSSGGFSALYSTAKTSAQAGYRQIYNVTASNIGSAISNSVNNSFVSIGFPGTNTSWGGATSPKFHKYVSAISTTLYQCYTQNPITKKYMAIGKDGFIYEGTSTALLKKNDATIIPVGNYYDMTFAGGKFCAICNIGTERKFIVIT